MPRPLAGDLDLTDLIALGGQHLASAALWPGFVAHGLIDALDPDLRDYLAALHALNARRNRKLAAQAAELANALNALAIEPVFLKGAAQLLLGLYPDPAIRLIGDMDVLVDARRLEAAREALRSIGYHDFGESLGHAHDPIRLLHPARPALVEMHQFPVPFVIEALLPTAELRARSVPLPSFGAARARAPCPTDLVLHNILHAMLQHRGYRLAYLPLRDGLDLALMSRRYGAEIDWTLIAARLSRGPGGPAPFAFYTAAAGEVFPAAPLPRPASGSMARLALWRWRGRRGRPPARLLYAALHLAEYAEDVAWRLRHLPAERRRLVALACAPRRYLDHLRRLRGIARDGLPTCFPGRRHGAGAVCEPPPG